jgi:glucokinase
MKALAVGIDLGGTNIKGGLVRRDGSVIVKKSVKTEVQKGTGPEPVVGRIAGLVADLIAEGGVDKSELVGVCVGSPGPLDSRRGIVYETPNLDWKDVPLSDMLSPLVDMPVFVENDANVAAFGEQWAGAAKDSQCTIMLTLGTGVGGGIVINGELWRGVNDVGAELGHMIIDYAGRLCGCGAHGCIEAYASASALARRMKEQVEAGSASSLRDAILAGEDVDAKRIYEAAVDGDRLSREMIEETGRLLGIAIVSYVNIFNPDCVVLHGGLVNAGDMLFQPLLAEVNERCFESSLRVLRVLPSALKGDAGIVGAAGLAFQRAEDIA